MYTINKIECFFPSGFKQVVTTDYALSEKPEKQVDRYLTQDDFQTTTESTLQARKLLKYTKVRNKYQVTIYIEAGVNLTVLQTAEYLKVTLQDGTILPYIDASELVIEQIQDTHYRAKFTFTELYSNSENEISYLTYPEIGSTSVNKLEFGGNTIYSKIKSKLERIKGSLQTLDIEDITYGVKSVDFDTVKCRFYLTLAQRNIVMESIHKETSVKFTTSEGTAYTSVELMEANLVEEPEIDGLYSWDMVLKYNKIPYYYE